MPCEHPLSYTLRRCSNSVGLCCYKYILRLTYTPQRNPFSYAVNLIGSGTPSKLLIVDFFIGEGDFGQQDSGIGYLNPKSSIKGSDDAWNWGKGSWDQGTGTIKFAVLQSIPAEAPTLTVRIVLKNRAVAQDAVRPYLRICGVTSWTSDFADGNTYPGFDREGYSGPALLGSNVQTLSEQLCPNIACVSEEELCQGMGMCDGFYLTIPGSDDGCLDRDEFFAALGEEMAPMFNALSQGPGCALNKAMSQGPTQTFGSVAFEPGGSAEIGTPEALVGRGISTQMYAALPQPGVLVPCNDATASDPTPTCSTLAGKLGTVLTVKSASFISDTLLQLRVDTSVLRRRGGCIVTDTKRSLSLCS